MLDVLIVVSMVSLSALVSFLLIQNRKLLMQNHILTVRDRVVELVGSVLDPLVQRLEDIRQTLETRNFLWSTNDEAVVVRELPREHIYEFQVDDRFYYPTPRLEILRSLLAGTSLLFQEERFVDFEEARPEVIMEINRLQNELESLGAVLKSLAIETVRYLNSERPNLFPDSVYIPYIAHLAVASLTMEPDDFENFLDRFAKNQELLQAKESWVLKRESILSGTKTVSKIRPISVDLESSCCRLTDQVTTLLQRLNDLRREYLRVYHIPRYLVDAHKERLLQAIKWKNESQCMNSKAG